jgi:diguanylate cyclase (GGDEF)-like protein
MISIKLPLEQELEDANEFLYLVSAIAFGVMLCIYLIIYYFYKAIIYRDMQIASKTKELEEMAKKDALTGAYNRHYLDSRFADDIDSLGDKTLSVMMIDIDYFKMINDNYGHQEGDKVLIALSKHIQSSLSDDCTFYRYGGEEFLVVLLAHDIDHAYDIAQTLRASIERYVVDNIDITVSIGVSQLIKGDTPDSIIKRADDALYIAKESGRNRVEVKK